MVCLKGSRRQRSRNRVIETQLEYRGHVYFESLPPYVINQLLEYLQLNIEFYLDIEIDISHIPSSLIEMIYLEHKIPVEADRSDQDARLGYGTDNYSFKEVDKIRIESEENPLDVYCITANETALINNSHFGNELTTIAPGEKNMLLSILNDCHCE